MGEYSKSEGQGILSFAKSLGPKFVKVDVQTLKCPKCGSGKKVVPIYYGKPVEIAEAVQSVDWAVGGCAIFLRLPDAYCKGCKHEWRKSGPESEGGKPNA